MPYWDEKLADMEIGLILGAKYHLVLTYAENNRDFINGVYECVETEKGLSLVVPKSDVNFNAIPASGGNAEWIFYASNGAFYIYETGYNAGADQAWESRISLVAEEYIKQLDEKYIPDTIARQTDIDDAKNDLLNGAGEAYDTLKELGDLINENADALQALETVAIGKADKVHNHDDLYYTKTEIDAFELITVDDIDAICGASITAATSEVKF